MKTLKLLAFLLVLTSLCSAQEEDEPTTTSWGMAQPVIPVSAPSLGELKRPLELEGSFAYNDSVSIAESITPEIQALARGLGNDPLRIFNYVHDHIRFILYFGSKKGAQLTLLEKSGNDFDQCALLMALLRAAGHTDAVYQFAMAQMPYQEDSHRDIKHWWGLEMTYGESPDWQTNVEPSVLTMLGIAGYPMYADSSYGTLFFHRIWVKLTLNGTEYLLDPAFKVSEQVTGVDLRAATGLNTNNLLSVASGTSTNNYVQNIDESALRNKLRDCTTSLLNHLQSNQPNASVDEVLGGWNIVPSTNSALSDSFDFLVYPGLPVLEWNNIPTNFMSTFAINFAGTNFQWQIPALQGQRLSLTFDASGTVKLWQEDNLLIQKSISGNAARTNVTVTINHPFGEWSIASNGLVDNGLFDKTATVDYRRTNATYALFYGFDVNADEVRRRQNQLDAYRQKGFSDSSREVQTETLNIMGLTWLWQTALSDRILDTHSGLNTSYHHRIGRMAQEPGNGYYVDIYEQFTDAIPRRGYDSVGTSNYTKGFEVGAYFQSALEHGMIEELQASNLTAASSVKMLALSSTNTSQKVFLATSNNWASVRSQLSGYTLSTLDAYIASNKTLLLPQNGNRALNGSGSWTGYGLVARDQAGGTMQMLIKGNYNGGFVSFPYASIDPYLISDTSSFDPDYFSDLSPFFEPEFGSDPVDMTDGTFTINHTDLSAGQSCPRGLSFVRTYTPARRFHNLAGMGNGWVNNYYLVAQEVSAPEAGMGGTTPPQMAPMIVATLASLDVYNLTPNAKNWAVASLIAKWGIDQVTKSGISICLGADTIQFVKQPDGSFTPPANCTLILLKTNSSYWLQERHGNTFKFNSAGRATNIVDRYGQQLKLAYNSSNWVTQISDWKNRNLTLSYSGTPLRLTSVTDDVGRSAVYGYTTNAGQLDLASVIDLENKTSTFLYDTNHQIVATKDALNRVVVSNSYDGFGRVTEQYARGDTNQAWRLYWSGFENTEEDPAGGRRTFYYDNKHRLTGLRDALGNLSQTAYDGQDHMVMTISPSGGTNQFIFDGNHNVTLTIDPLGYTNRFFYDDKFNLFRLTDKRGNPSTFGYNGQFQLTGFTNGSGDWTTFVYHATNGTLTSRTDSGGTTAYEYDSTYFQLVRIAYPGNLGSEGFLNNSLGDVLSHTNGRGFVTGFKYNLRRELTNTIAPLNLTNSAAYDSVGNVLSETDARGFTRSHVWSVTSKLLSTTLPTTPQGPPVTTNIYDNRDWLVRTVNPLQQSTSFTNDAAGRTTVITDPLNRSTRFGFDADGRKVAITNAAQEASSQAWTARGERTQATDAANRKTLLQYDAAGNQVTLTNRNGEKWQFQFDGANRLTNTITPLLRSTKQIYNDRGLLATNVEPSTETTSFSYDAKGRLTNRTDAVGTTVYRLDPNNNVTEVIEAGKTNAWTFDDHDRASSYRDTDGNLIQYRYDQNGNLTNLIYPGNRTVVYAYDSLNRLTNVTDWSNRKTSFEYDLASRMKKVMRPNGTVREIDYDVAGQLTNIIERLTNNYPIAFFRLNWNTAGRMAWEFTAPLPHTNALPTRAMTYDDDDRLATFNGQTIVHDSDGNMTSGPLTNGTLVSYGYNARNQLLSAGGVNYGYDPQGNRTTLTNGTNTVRFVVNPNAALPQVLMRVRSGVTTYYIYGPGLLYEITETATSTNTLTYHYDYRGSTVALTDGSGMPTDRMEYSAYGTQTYRTGTNDTPFLFNGRCGVQADANGLLYMRARYYNPHLCRFINADPSGFSGGLNFYAYANGNPISLIDPFGLGAVDENAGASWLHNQFVMETVGMLAALTGFQPSQPLPDYIYEFFGISPPSPQPPSAFDQYMTGATASLTPEEHLTLMALGTSRAPSAPTAGGAGQTFATGKEWYDYFAAEYGEQNVEWTSGSGRTMPWPNELPMPENTEMLRVSPGPRSSSFVFDLESLAGPRPFDTIAHHNQPLGLNGVDSGLVNGSWVDAAAHQAGHGAVNSVVNSVPYGTWIIVR